MITREQVADLRPGDVVELTFPSGSRIRGPLTDNEYEAQRLKIASTGWTVRSASGDPGSSLRAGGASLTVVSLAPPRQLYVNHPRTEPVIGDVVIDEDADETVIVFRVAGQQYRDPDRWIDQYGTERTYEHLSPPRRLRLLVDGKTAEIVR